MALWDASALPRRMPRAKGGLPSFVHLSAAVSGLPLCIPRGETDWLHGEAGATKWGVGIPQRTVLKRAGHRAKRGRRGVACANQGRHALVGTAGSTIDEQLSAPGCAVGRMRCKWPHPSRISVFTEGAHTCSIQTHPTAAALRHSCIPATGCSHHLTPERRGIR